MKPQKQEPFCDYRPTRTLCRFGDRAWLIKKHREGPAGPLAAFLHLSLQISQPPRVNISYNIFSSVYQG